MASIIPRGAGFVCHLCRRQRQATRAVSAITTTLTRGIATTPAKNSSRASIRQRAQPTERQVPAKKLHKEGNDLRPAVSAAQLTSPDLSGRSSSFQDLAKEEQKIITSETVPAEAEVLEFLQRCLTYSNFLIFSRAESPPEIETAFPDEIGAESSLFTLDEPSSKDPNETSKPQDASLEAWSDRDNEIAKLAKMTYDVLCAPNVFINPAILESYVRIHCLLDTPQYLPKIFHLYANKPIPKPNTSPVKYTKPWPQHPKNAVPQGLSDEALEAAISQKDLPLAISIIETTVAQPAFRYNKILRRATVPLLGVGLTPVVAWALAEKFAEYQNTWDPEMAKFIVMSSSMAYVSTLGIVGFVALTTYNDHFQRVVWQPGMNLRDRWLREEERLYFDRVAMAWGFKERHRRGEEQGEEWDALREFVGMRSMVLDRSNLLEGME